MSRHSTSASPSQQQLHEIESIATSVEKMQKNFDCSNGGCIAEALNRIATALETIAAKP